MYLLILLKSPLLLMMMFVLVCVNSYHCGAQGGQNNVSGHLEIALQVVVRGLM